MKFNKAFTILAILAFWLLPTAPATPLALPGDVLIRASPIIEVVGNVIEWLVDLIPNLIEGIDGLVHDKEERADFVLNVLNQARLFIAASPPLSGYNVLVVDHNHHYVAYLTEVVAQFKLNYPGELFGINHQTYDMFIFKGGSFQLNGDGGWENWAYTGGQILGPGEVAWP